MQSKGSEASGAKYDVEGVAGSGIRLWAGISDSLRSEEQSSLLASSGQARTESIRQRDNPSFIQGIPDFAEKELESLHPNIFAVPAQIRLHYDDDDITTYVLCDHSAGAKVTELLLLRRRKGVVQVLSEGIHLSSARLGRFIDDVLAAWPDVDAITFHASIIDTAGISYPTQRYVCGEDIVLTLPPSLAAYQAMLGKSTRSYLNRYLGKLKRNYPGFAHRVMTGDDIDEAVMRALIAMNRKRMEAKGKTSILDDAATQRIIALAQRYGMVSVITIDGKVCAGTINYAINGHYFLDVIAHDPEYNDYRVGTLGCYLTICECVARGGSEYHFLWGQSDYKFRLGGVQRDLEHVTVFRSRWHMLAHPTVVARNSAARCERLLRMRLAREDRMARAARALLQRFKA